MFPGGAPVDGTFVSSKKHSVGVIFLGYLT